jgi:hypothetical protein
MGEHITEHEADGSDLDENAMSAEARASAKKKQAEAKPGSGASYETRQATTQPPRPKPPGE